MAKEMMLVGDLSDAVKDEVMVAFTDYSVAIARVRDENAETFTALGSGALVSKGQAQSPREMTHERSQKQTV
jgi:hypothetical protein